MLHQVLGALNGARFTHLGAKRTYRLHVDIAAGNRCRGKAAYIGAFQIQSDAVNHPFWITLLETGVGALKAGGRTFVAGLKAFFLDLTQHFNLRLLSNSWANRRVRSVGSLCACTLGRMVKLF
jgi:hypothetical protein